QPLANPGGVEISGAPAIGGHRPGLGITRQRDQRSASTARQVAPGGLVFGKIIRFEFFGPDAGKAGLADQLHSRIGGESAGLGPVESDPGETPASARGTDGDPARGVYPDRSEDSLGRAAELEIPALAHSHEFDQRTADEL